MTSFGETTAAEAMTKALERFVPGVDAATLAEVLLEAVDVAAVHSMNERETQMMAALTASMDYTNGVSSSQRARIASLERECKMLKRALLLRDDPETKAWVAEMRAKVASGEIEAMIAAQPDDPSRLSSETTT